MLINVSYMTFFLRKSLSLKPKLLNMIRFNTQMRVKVINCPNTRIKIWVIDRTSYFMLTRVNLKLYHFNIFFLKNQNYVVKIVVLYENNVWKIMP